MAETINIGEASEKGDIYRLLLPQIKALIGGESDLIANLANITAALHDALGFFWVGFYKTDSPAELVLGPFQGPVACTRIRYGKGVCGTAWKEKSTIIVPNVDEFPGHIACSSLSKSEIVLCLMKNDEVRFILDIDSDKLNDFDDTDRYWLEKLCKEIIEPII